MDEQTLLEFERIAIVGATANVFQPCKLCRAALKDSGLRPVTQALFVNPHIFKVAELPLVDRPDTARLQALCDAAGGQTASRDDKSRQMFFLWPTLGIADILKEAGETEAGEDVEAQTVGAILAGLDE